MPIPVIAHREGDVLLLPELVCLWGDRQAVLDRWSAQSTVIALVYDLIPITHPHLFDAELTRCFARAVDWAAGHCDGALCISRATADELSRWLGAREGAGQRLYPSALAVGRLGADFAPASASQAVRPVLSRFLDAPGSVYLAVGTIEPRKNLGCLLDAFDQIWDGESDARLLILGRRGWLSGPVIQRLRRHPRLGRSLLWMENASDAELHHAYGAARALVYASLVEGFGLPLVEAMRLGTPVLANDIPVFREIGADHCAYFDATRPETLVGLLTALERTGVFPGAGPAGFTWPDWKTCAWETLDAVVTLAIGSGRA